MAAALMHSQRKVSAREANKENIPPGQVEIDDAALRKEAAPRLRDATPTLDTLSQPPLPPLDNAAEASPRSVLDLLAALTVSPTKKQPAPAPPAPARRALAPNVKR